MTATIIAKPSIHAMGSSHGSDYQARSISAVMLTSEQTMSSLSIRSSSAVRSILQHVSAIKSGRMLLPKYASLSIRSSSVIPLSLSELSFSMIASAPPRFYTALISSSNSRVLYCITKSTSCFLVILYLDYAIYVSLTGPFP